MPNKLTETEIQKLIPLVEQTKWHYRLDKFTDESLGLINKSINQARREIAAKLATINPKSEFTKQRLETLAQELQDMTVAIQHKITGQIESTALEVAAKSYPKHADILSFGGLVPNFNNVQLTAAQLKSIIDTPLGGKLLNKWVETAFTANIKDKFQEGIAAGMLKGESYKNLVKRFKTDAFTRLEKDMEAITRTQVQSINTNAMKDTMTANADIMKGWKWNSVYENRTCIRCMSLDAKDEVYPIDGGPQIPLHVNCRCFPEPITKTFRELGVDIDEMEESYRPYTIRGKIDPVTGRVIPGKIGVGGGRIIDTGRFLGSYDDFFKQLPENVQTQMLGPTRFGMYKEGKLTLAGMTDASGNAYLIKELKKGIKKSSFTMTVDETLIKTAAKALSEKEILSNANLINKAMLKKAKDLDIEEEFMILTGPRSYSPSNSYWSSRPIAAGETKAQLEAAGWAVDEGEVYFQKNPPKWMPKDLAGKQLSSTFASNVNLQSYFGEPPNIPAMTNFKKMLEGKYGKKFQLSAELVQKNNQAIFREMYGESTKFYRAGGVKPGVQSMSESTSAAKHAASVVGKTSKVTSEGVEIFEHQILVSHRGFVTPYPEKEWVVDLSAKAAKKEAKKASLFTDTTISKLTDDEWEALNAYKMYGWEVNEPLRKYKTGIIRIGDEYPLNVDLDALDSAFDSAAKTLNKNTIVYRGLPKNTEVKSLFTDKGFTSTTLDKNSARLYAGKEGKIIEIHLPKGMNVVKMADYVEDVEGELLLKRNLSFIKTSEGKYKVNTKYVDYNDGLIHKKVTAKVVAKEKARVAQEIFDTLTSGEVVDAHEIRGGSNIVQIITLEKDGKRRTGIFKPIYGEESDMRGTVSNSKMPYAHREVLASELSEEIGFGRVPMTVFREVDGKEGSVQLFIENATSFRAAKTEKLLKSRASSYDAFETSVFDYLIGNTDRHTNNMLFDSQFRMSAIDHGLSFPNGRLEFRNKVGKEFALAKYPGMEGIKGSVKEWYKDISNDFIDKIHSGLLSKNIDSLLSKYQLSKEELEAFRTRKKYLLDNLYNSEFLMSILTYDPESPAFKILNKGHL